MITHPHSDHAQSHSASVFASECSCSVPPALPHTILDIARTETWWSYLDNTLNTRNAVTKKTKTWWSYLDNTLNTRNAVTKKTKTWWSYLDNTLNTRNAGTKKTKTWWSYLDNTLNTCNAGTKKTKAALTEGRQELLTRGYVGRASGAAGWSAVTGTTKQHGLQLSFRILRGETAPWTGGSCEGQTSTHFTYQSIHTLSQGGGFCLA